MIRIAVDAMGGDHAPEAIVAGSLAALRQRDDLHITFTGVEARIRPLLGDAPAERFSVVDCPDVISTDEDPLLALRKKRQSSLLVALDLLKKKDVQAAISAGSTGAFNAGALFNVGRIKGIERPALAPVLPTATGSALLIDCGANADCKPDFLVQFAIMGSVYMNTVMGVDRPRVGLLNIGAEEEKGNALYKQAHQLLKQAPIAFVGNVEARDALSGQVDVIVADGFAGNILLKAIEGTALYLMGVLKEQFLATPLRKMGALLLKGAFGSVKKKLDYKEYGGALLIGVSGVAIKAHGSSDARAFQSAIAQACTAVKKDMVGSISAALTNAEL